MSFIKSEPTKVALYIIGACIVCNGFAISISYIYDAYDRLSANNLAEVVEMIDHTHNIDRKLELMNILRDACINNPKWQKLDEDDDTHQTCDWAMGTDI